MVKLRDLIYMALTRIINILYNFIQNATNWSLTLITSVLTFVFSKTVFEQVDFSNTGLLSFLSLITTVYDLSVPRGGLPRSWARIFKLYLSRVSRSGMLLVVTFPVFASIQNMLPVFPLMIVYCILALKPNKKLMSLNYIWIVYMYRYITRYITYHKLPQISGSSTKFISK